MSWRKQDKDRAAEGGKLAGDAARSMERGRKARLRGADKRADDHEAQGARRLRGAVTIISAREMARERRRGHNGEG